MKVYQSFKFEIEPKGQQQLLMRRFFDSCRFVYNKALALQQENYTAQKDSGEAKPKFISCFDMTKRFTQWSKEPALKWLNKIGNLALRGALYNLNQAYCNFLLAEQGILSAKNGSKEDS